MKCRQVDMLVMATEYTPESAWKCTGCDIAAVQKARPVVCPNCGCSTTRGLDVKEELVRLAEVAGCGVEIVHDSETLMRLGGVGCLLRYLSPEAHREAAANNSRCRAFVTH